MRKFTLAATADLAEYAAMFGLSFGGAVVVFEYLGGHHIKRCIEGRPC